MRVAVLLGVAGLVVPTTGAAVQADATDGPCARELAAQRAAWRVLGPAREQPPLTDGQRIRHWPTDTLGVWLRERVGDDTAALARVGGGVVLEVVWNATCSAMTHERARPLATSPRFTDDDLSTRVNSGRSGVIYVWSPHMPLSVDAFTALAQAARTHGLAVDVVLDPAADRSFAARIVAQRGLPANATRVADSVELQFRDVLLHAPTVQAYAGGRLVGSPFPGGHTAAEYGAYLDRVLAGRGR